MERNAALAQKLALAFPVLADEDGAGAIKPYGAWHPAEERAKPVTIVLAPDGGEAWRHDGVAAPDRPATADVLQAVAALGLPLRNVPDARATVPGIPSDEAFPRERIAPFFRPIASATRYLDEATQEPRARRLRRFASEVVEALETLD